MSFRNAATRSTTYVIRPLLTYRTSEADLPTTLPPQDCFVHVYGPLPERSRFGDVRKPQSFGVCGVCRKSMKVGESGAAGNVSSGKASSGSRFSHFSLCS
jgi:hypothetical protein